MLRPPKTIRKLSADKGLAASLAAVIQDNKEILLNEFFDEDQYNWGIQEILRKIAWRNLEK
jgi:hypothetical protein